ncbi:ubiquinol-cytochrome c chaperone [Alsobacter sp. SYSU M60028]|uniref:Ubiquinol-cytochrome c chaperone n=1 Tax=Alsobacter ponti TaxID=2962936 RepID=A0ABT1LBM9_9HYPH|nr:ubiquinol-cytochrome C chaperone family protein [Alsobacter ponti]MCP8938348.1 ubiquinol-cytochrome c chaperone [Alsobacter ponti]
MIFNLFRRRDPNAAIVERLVERLYEAARQPVFFRELGVPDTVEGRFDMVVIHAFLALRRLNALPAPAGDLAQDVVDALFRSFDTALRELGVGDISVPKRMKTMAAAFYGRGKAYEQALADGDALADAVALNLYGRTPSVPDAPAKVARYMQASAARLSELEFADFVDGLLPFPSPLPEDRA